MAYCKEHECGVGRYRRIDALSANYRAAVSELSCRIVSIVHIIQILELSMPSLVRLSSYKREFLSLHSR